MSENVSYGDLKDFLIKMEAMPDTFSAGVGEALSKICAKLRIGKIEVCFYDSPEKEKTGSCKRKILYQSADFNADNFITERRVTDTSNVVIYTVFGSKNNTAWDNDEKDCIKLIITMLFVFNGRSKLMELSCRLNFYDNDMNIYNHKSFMKKAGELLASGKIFEYTAVYLNLKRFSVVNLQIGRENGTLVMKRYIDYISSLMQDENEITARIGGDNFALLVRNDNLPAVVEAINGTTITYDDISGDRIYISATAGIYEIDGKIPLHAPTDIMDRISIAFNAAKSRTKHNVAYFDEIMMERSRRELHISSVFRNAMNDEEFLVYYQPKVSMEEYRICGAEALCRWKHEGKLVPPSDFIPVLERGMEICRLDFYMLDHVCRDIRRWLDMGKKAVKISVNLSRRHLSNVSLLQDILETIDRNNVPHEYIELELTETTTDVEFHVLKELISGLQAAGISTSVDDFGVGYSSLTLIKDISWDVLKIDKSFLPEAGEKYDLKKKIMLRHVVAIAQEIGLECVAEGVETKEQVELLKTDRCNVVQGFYFDKPLPAEEFEKRLNNYQYFVV
ncbi:MAG: GGDEF domain-containing protein [Ruminococcus sp.]|nr:GGDEF domain-containing protein [Ruminococcus sp.]